MRQRLREPLLVPPRTRTPLKAVARAAWAWTPARHTDCRLTCRASRRPSSPSAHHPPLSDEALRAHALRGASPAALRALDSRGAARCNTRALEATAACRGPRRRPEFCSNAYGVSTQLAPAHLSPRAAAAGQAALMHRGCCRGQWVGRAQPSPRSDLEKAACPSPSAAPGMNFAAAVAGEADWRRSHFLTFVYRTHR